MTDITAPIAGIDGPDATSFEEFWPYYLSQHMESGTRLLHVTGTSIGLLVAISAILRRRFRRLLLAPIVGYAFAWVGHFFIEGNKPATFDAPGWSLRGDFRLLARTFARRIDDDVDAVRRALATTPGSPTRGERAA